MFQGYVGKFVDSSDVCVNLPLLSTLAGKNGVTNLKIFGTFKQVWMYLLCIIKATP